MRGGGGGGGGGGGTVQNCFSKNSFPCSYMCTKRLKTTTMISLLISHDIILMSPSVYISLPLLL